MIGGRHQEPKEHESMWHVSAHVLCLCALCARRRVEKHWRLIGWGQIQKGLKMDMPEKQ